MALPPDFALILDHARAEAKRYGHGEVVLEHLAAALARRNAKTFADAFGPDAEARLEPLLDRLPAGRGAPTDSLKLVELLANAAASPRKTEVLIDAVRELLKSQPAVAPVELAAKAAERAAEPEIEPAPSSPAPIPPAPLDKAALLRQLKSRIVGQDEALEIIVDRLALTRMQFDLRPNRPDGVFLLAGASGTGKTAFARALAEFLYGGESHLISLDMSEYAHDWAVSRLTGPMPGYVGSDKPEGWLTTRVRRQPESLILLDEIEKSHPTVWNTFLQVFNDGRLTDGQGREADFSRTVVVMTSNLGSENFRRKHPLGFHSGDATTEAAERTLEAVKQAMPPEFINRIDAVVLFNPLAPEVIHEIARREVSGALDRLRERGYVTEVPADVIQFIAADGYEPAFGARHLHRSIERHLLQTLVTQTPGRLRARVTADEVHWETQPT
jgi:ATP-dependent Clp protease ATP-binding subunit ClpA